MILKSITGKIGFFSFLGFLFLTGIVYLAQAELFLSTDIPVTIESNSFKERDVFSYDPPDFSSYISGTNLFIPEGVNLDALTYSGNYIVFSMDKPVEMDLGVVRERDIFGLDFSNGITSWRLLNGDTVGIPEGACIDAATVLEDSRIVFSLDIPVKIGTLDHLFKANDLIVYNGDSVDLYYSGSDMGIPEEANLDGVWVNPSGDILFSLDIPTVVDGLKVTDKDIIEWNGVSVSLYFDGLAAGIPENANVDACTFAECEGDDECNDFNECTTDSCVSGSCEHTPVSDGTGCDDGQYCSINDECSEGDCIGSLRGCDDGFFCTGPEECDEATDQCVSIGNPCFDDGEYCNGTESCNETTDECENSGNPCPDDGIFCNGLEDCDEVGEQCVHTGDPCPDDGEFCNGTESCNETSDECENSGNPCVDDGFFCNGLEECNEVGDQCLNTGDPCPDDGEYCNGTESCNETTDECENSGDPCPDDDLFCNGEEVCDEGNDQCENSGDPCFPLVCDEDLDVCEGSGDDGDGDGIPDSQDNCPTTPNPGQEDTYPPQGNGIGDACDCESDFDCDGDVDADDVATFLVDFGRFEFNNPCVNDNQCNGDFECDTDVDADDVEKFLEDFGRFQFNNPCPACVAGDWCVYP